MKNFSKNAITLIFVLALNFGGIGAYYFVYSQVVNLNRHAADVREDIDLKTAQKADDKALKTILDSTKDDREKIDTYLLREDGVVRFIESIESLGSLTKTVVTTSSVNVDDSGSAKTGFLTMRITAKGTFENTMNFISLVENVPHQVWIDKLSTSVTTKAEGSKVQEWQTEFDLKVLKVKPETNES